MGGGHVALPLDGLGQGSLFAADESPGSLDVRTSDEERAVFHIAKSLLLLLQFCVPQPLRAAINPHTSLANITYQSHIPSAGHLHRHRSR